MSRLNPDEKEVTILPAKFVAFAHFVDELANAGCWEVLTMEDLVSAHELLPEEKILRFSDVVASECASRHHDDIGEVVLEMGVPKYLTVVVHRAFLDVAVLRCWSLPYRVEGVVKKTYSIHGECHRDRLRDEI